ncbi:MAG TPA: ATP-binding protein [Ferruginibacter sp.]|nr:ATP-binding protein [Ferruginibacter sp.]HRE62865.1 ATP-binding protein [Ferruginibacter sp.]
MHPDEASQITLIFTIIVLFFLLTIGICVLVFMFFNNKKKYLHEKQLIQSQHTQALLQSQLKIKEQTLKNISEEIHDNVGQALSLAKLNLNTLDINTGAGKEEKIEKSIDLLSKAIHDLRNLSRNLNGEKEAGMCLTDAIDNELQIIQNAGLMQTSFIMEGNPYSLQNHDEMVIFRIVQEALNNTVKHSNAKNIYIRVNYQPAYCNISIEDDGVGFNAMPGAEIQVGIGLKNMQNRAALIGASLKIEAIPGKGTKVQIQKAIK